MRNRLTVLALLLAVLAFTPAAFAAPAASDAPAPASVAPADCGAPAVPDLATFLDPLAQTLQPHCCSQQEVDTCRSDCKAQGPGCKGQIGCRAGECVCTCVCPG